MHAYTAWSFLSSGLHSYIKSFNICMYINTCVYKYICVHTYVYAHIYVALIYFSWTVKTASYRAIKNKLHLHQCLTTHAPQKARENVPSYTFWTSLHLLMHLWQKFQNSWTLLRTPFAWYCFNFCWKLRSLLLPVFFKNEHAGGSVLFCEKT